MRLGTYPVSWTANLSLKEQANYINALAVSVLPFFEPAKPITLGEHFVT
jgi:hypothetical protein